MNHDRELTISVGQSRKSVNWQPYKTRVSSLYARLQSPVRGEETLNDYIQLPKGKQDELKDIGGFVGGVISGGRRKSSAIVNREIVTLDLDTIPALGTKTVLDKLESLGVGYCVYSTRKHSENGPRLRVLIPLERPVAPDEYEPIARKLCDGIGMNFADPSTFEIARLMYWPSCCADTQYVFKYADKPFAKPDEILASYTDWKNWSEWPQVQGSISVPRLAAKQGAPEEKPGIVGIFNRCYRIKDAIEKFLPGVYTETDDENRLTFAHGSTAAGAVLYNDGKFLYSHHATDPCSERLVNAFDLVRLHKFDDLDDQMSTDTEINKLPSYKAMVALASNDAKVIDRTAQERTTAALSEYTSLTTAATQNGTEAIVGASDGVAESEEEKDLTAAEVVMKLELRKDGEPKPTIHNVRKILENDSALKGRFAFNAFSNCVEVVSSLPWNASPKRRRWSDTDNNGIYWYIETLYHISSRSCIDSALDLYASSHAFNEVQDFLNSLVWDGKPRLDTLLIDTLGAEDTEYTRAVTRKMFTAAVARAMEPGTKFDNMLILCGPQGCGKSTLIDIMSMGWYNDSIRTFEGKEASELLPGVWLAEIAELDAFRKSDVSRVKQFLSLRADRYRAAYGKNVSEYPRKCVFFGTCNQAEFLVDVTGNRRFWPVDVMVQKRRTTPWELSKNDIHQIWAEAKTRYQVGEPLMLTGSAAEAALDMQEEHRESSISEGLIAEFAEKDVPVDYAKWSVSKRQEYWNGLIAQDVPTMQRTKICAAEIWCEMYGGSLKDCDRFRTRDINSVLDRLKGWKKAKTPLRFGPYKQQRGYTRIGYAEGE